MAAGRLNGKVLTENLRKLAGEVHELLPDGTQLTREEVLSRLIWQQALGWTEEVRDDLGNRTRKVHPPVSWCQQFLFERMEGRAPQAVQDESSSMRAADKVRELSKQRLNALASAAIGPPKVKKEASNGE